MGGRRSPRRVFPGGGRGEVVDLIETLPSPCDAPEIVSLSFPATISNVPGSVEMGTIEFRDRNGDVVQECRDVISGDANEGCIDVEGVHGMTEGTIPFTWRCPEGTRNCTTGEVTN